MSSRLIKHLVPVFILETTECMPKFVKTDNAFSSIKTANEDLWFLAFICERLRFVAPPCIPLKGKCECTHKSLRARHVVWPLGCANF